jgi:hypothetical protein
MDEFDRFYETTEEFLTKLVNNNLNPNNTNLYQDISKISEVQVQVEDMDDETINCVLMISKHCTDEDYVLPERDSAFGIMIQPKDEIWIPVMYFYKHSIWDVNQPDDSDIEKLGLDGISNILESLIKRYDSTN